MKHILILDDDIDTSLNYKIWLENEVFRLTLIKDLRLAEVRFKPQNYELVLIGFKMSVGIDFIFMINYMKYQKK